jgi:chemotaxis protein MotB
MFASASADLRPYMRDLLRAIGRVLNDVPNRLSLSGHTDAAPFAGGERGFSNWELSANRANASRREMIAGGLEPTRVIRVVGLSDMIPLNAKDPLDPINRRISIIVLNRKTEEALLAESAARAANGTANGGGSGTGPDSAPAGDAAAPQPPAAVVSPGG